MRMTFHVVSKVVSKVCPPFNGLKRTGALARAWVVAFHGDPTSLARDNIIVKKANKMHKNKMRTLPYRSHVLLLQVLECEQELEIESNANKYLIYM